MAKLKPKFRELDPGLRDPARDLEMRRWFSANVDRVYHKCAQLIGIIRFREFVDIVREAHRVGVWGYKHLNASELPYVILVAYRSFPTRRRPYPRPHRFTCFFPPQAGSEEFWMFPQTATGEMFQYFPTARYPVSGQVIPHTLVDDMASFPDRVPHPGFDGARSAIVELLGA